MGERAELTFEVKSTFFLNAISRLRSFFLKDQRESSLGNEAKLLQRQLSVLTTSRETVPPVQPKMVPLWTHCINLAKEFCKFQTKPALSSHIPTHPAAPKTHSLQHSQYSKAVTQVGRALPFFAAPTLGVQWSIYRGQQPAYCLSIARHRSSATEENRRAATSFCFAKKTTPRTNGLSFSVLIFR